MTSTVFTYDMTTKRQSDIQPGDIVEFLGGFHRIDRIEPPTAETLAFFPTCIGYAKAENGWGISLASDPWLTLEVV